MIATLLLASAIALSFDDLPGSALPRRDRCDAAAIMKWNEKLLATLRKHHAPAIGFVNSGRDCVRKELPQILELWLRDGHQLANHTAHHVDAHAISVAAFERDVIAGETPLRDVLQRHGQKLVWFRHPMLHTGLTIEARDEIASFLTKRGYRNGVVTLDSDEFLYNNAYATSYPEHAQLVAKAYIPFMESVLTFMKNARAT